MGDSELYYIVLVPPIKDLFYIGVLNKNEIKIVFCNLRSIFNIILVKFSRISLKVLMLILSLTSRASRVVKFCAAYSPFVVVDGR
jgi:hypothetical protein